VCVETKWILEQLNSLSGRRNVAFHSPLTFINEHTASTAEEIEIVPSYFFGNPHAVKLRDKNLIDEFRWYRDHLSKLASHAEALHYVLIFPEHTLPDRPRLLPREQFLSQGRRRRKSETKSSPRRPRSSRA